MGNCDVRKVREKLEKMNYGLVEETSAVQICRWTKNMSHAEARLAYQNFFKILDKKHFENKFRNFQFMIPKKIVAPSALPFLMEV